jgi:small-conductance mechanosensitive channel
MLELLYNKYIIALGIIIITLFLSKITGKLLKIILHISSKTKTKLDDIVINMIKRPVKIIVLTVGFFIAFKYIYPDFVVGSINITSIFKVIWILAGAILINKIVNAFFIWYTEELQHKLHRKIDPTIFQFIRKIVNILIYVSALLAILSSFGVEITPMLAGLGIGGLAIALALKDTLANFFGALFMTVDRPMKIGDFIELDDKTAGYVNDIGWRTTRIKTWDGNFLIIPNSKIADALLKNYNSPKTNLTFSIGCGVSYDSDLKKVEKVVLDVAKKIIKKEDGAIKDFEPFVRFNEFGDSSINFAVFLESKSRADKFKIKHEFIKALHERFNKEKIEIPFPQIDVHNKK